MVCFFFFFCAAELVKYKMRRFLCGTPRTKCGIRALTITPIAMPALSPTMTTGTLVSWRKKVGDPLAPGEILCDVGTDKATLEFENVAEEGIVARYITPEGTTGVTVGDIIALLVDDKGALQAPQVLAWVPPSGGVKKAENISAASTTPPAPPPPPPSQEGRGGHATSHMNLPRWYEDCGPAARVAYLALADSVKTTLTPQGTGFHGRVTKGDVARAATQTGRPPAVAAKVASVSSEPVAPVLPTQQGRPVGVRSIVPIANYALSDAAIIDFLIKTQKKVQASSSDAVASESKPSKTL